MKKLAICAMAALMAVTLATAADETLYEYGLQWDAPVDGRGEPVDGVVGYRLYQSGATNWTSRTTTLSVLVTNVPGGYLWYVVAVNELGVESEPSNVYEARVWPPPSPRNLRATGWVRRIIRALLGG